MPKIPGHVPTCGSTELLLLARCETCKRVTVWLVFPEKKNARLCLGHSRQAMTKEQIHRAELRERERQNPQLF